MLPLYLKPLFYCRVCLIEDDVKGVKNRKMSKFLLVSKKLLICLFVFCPMLPVVTLISLKLYSELYRSRSGHFVNCKNNHLIIMYWFLEKCKFPIWSSRQIKIWSSGAPKKRVNRLDFTFVLTVSLHCNSFVFPAKKNFHYHLISRLFIFSFQV